MTKEAPETLGIPSPGGKLIYYRGRNVPMRIVAQDWRFIRIKDLTDLYRDRKITVFFELRKHPDGRLLFACAKKEDGALQCTARIYASRRTVPMNDASDRPPSDEYGIDPNDNDGSPGQPQNLIAIINGIGSDLNLDSRPLFTCLDAEDIV